MAQNGSLLKDHGAWYLRYYEGKKRRKIWLGRIEDYPTQRLIRPRLEEERTKLREASDTCTTLTNYIEHQFLPEVEARLRPSTVAGYRGLLDRYIKGRGEIRLWLIQPHHVQTLLNSVAEDRILRKTTYSHLKAFLSVVFNHARNYGFYQRANPVTGVFIPARSLPSRATKFYTLEEIEKVLPVLEGSAKAAVAIAGYAGLRLAEIQGLTWDCYDGETLTVEETEWRGYRSPTKSKASADFVPVIEPLRAILEEYRRSQPITGILFPESLENIGRVQVRAAMKRVGLSWKGWHSFRRGLGGNLFELGVSDKIVQRILRHSRVTITRDRYIKVRDPQVDAAMKALENRTAIIGRADSTETAANTD